MIEEKNQRFIKFIPSEEAFYLQEYHPNVLLLLLYVAHRARRVDGLQDGLKSGEAMIGDYKKAGIETEKKYRTAKRIAVERGHLEIIETCRTRLARATENKNEGGRRATERATERATVGTKVKLLSSNVYDINIIHEGDRKGDVEGGRRATENKNEGDELRKTKTKKEKKIEEASSKTIVGIVHKSLLEVRELDDSQKQELSAKFSEDVVQRALAHVSSSSFVIKKSFDSALYYYCQHPEQIRESRLDKFKSQQQMQDERLEMIERNRSRCQQFAKLIHGNGRICRLTPNALEVSNFKGDKKMSVYFSSPNVEYEIQQLCDTFEVRNE